MIISKFDITVNEEILLNSLLIHYKEKRGKEERKPIKRNLSENPTEEELEAYVINEEIPLFDKDREKEEFLEGYIERLLNHEEGSVFFDGESFSSEELLSMYRYIERRIGLRYMERINFSKETLLEDFSEVLERYTVTDLEKDIRRAGKLLLMGDDLQAFNKKLYRLLDVNELGDKEEFNKKKEDLKIKELSFIAYSCLESRIQFFASCPIIIDDMYYKEIEKKLGLPIYWSLFVDGPFAYNKETGEDIELYEAMESNYTDNPLYNDWIGGVIEEKLDQLVEDRFNSLWPALISNRLKQKERNSKRSPRSAVKNQITIEEAIKEAEANKISHDTYKEITKETEAYRPTYTGPLTQRLLSVVPKQKKQAIQMGKRTNVYKNDFIGLKITEENDTLLQLTKSSIPFYIYTAGELAKKWSFSQITDNTYSTISFPLSDMMKAFGKDYNSATARNDFIKEQKLNMEIWKHATAYYEDKNGDSFQFYDMISNPGYEKGFFKIGFTPEVARELLKGQLTHYPQKMFSLDNASWQICGYLNWQSQMFNNIENDKSPVFILPNGNIEIRRSVRSLLDYVTSLKYKEILETDKSHFMREVIKPLEEKLLDLTDKFPISDEPGAPNHIIRWSYKSSTEDRVLLAQHGDFPNINQWLEEIIIFEVPAPKEFKEKYNKHIEDKKEAERKKKDRERKAKERAHKKALALKKNKEEP